MKEKKEVDDTAERLLSIAMTEISSTHVIGFRAKGVSSDIFTIHEASAASPPPKTCQPTVLRSEQLYSPLTVKFEIGFSCEQSMILFLTHISVVLTFYG